MVGLRCRTRDDEPAFVFYTALSDRWATTSVAPRHGESWRMEPREREGAALSRGTSRGWAPGLSATAWRDRRAVRLSVATGGGGMEAIQCTQDTGVPVPEWPPAQHPRPAGPSELTYTPRTGDSRALVWASLTELQRSHSESDPAPVGVGTGVREVDQPLQVAAEDAERARTRADKLQPIARR